MTEDLKVEDEPEEGGEAMPRPAYGTTRAPRSPRISQGDVLQAADALLLEGHRPTIDRVRMRLGRGSPNTIQEYLEVWWTKLGSRINDIPGREIPGIPDPVAQSLQGLWNTALDNARASLDEGAAAREQAVVEQESALVAREERLVEQERLIGVRVASLEEALDLARSQLVAANGRADRLEESARSREADGERLRQRAEEFEHESREVRAKLDAALSAHQIERRALDERSAASEARWMLEVDRARQALKEATQDGARQAKELRGQIGHLQAQRDALKRELKSTRTEARSAQKVSAQLDKRIRALMVAAKVPVGTRPAASNSSASKPLPSRRRKAAVREGGR